MGVLDDQVLGPIYESALIACDAIYTPVNGSPTPVRAIDFTAGVQFGDGVSKGFSIQPAAAVRKASVSLGPSGGSFSVNAINYIIDGYVVGPAQINNQVKIAAGEILLILKAA